MCSAEEWNEDELFNRIRRSYPYRKLDRANFDAILEMLSEGINARPRKARRISSSQSRSGSVRGRRGSRLAAITSGGAIPDNSLYTVVAEPEGNVVGTVDEDFAVESLSGDIMLLGNTSWRIRRVHAGRVLVEDAHGAAPMFRSGGAPARTAELSQQVAGLREKVNEMTAAVAPSPKMRDSQAFLDAVAWLQIECAVDRAGAEQIVEHIIAGRAVLGVVPTQKVVVAERFFDESGGMQLVMTLRLAVASTKPGAWRYANVFAGRSTWNCRRPRQTMASTSAWQSNIVFRLPKYSGSFTPLPSHMYWNRQFWILLCLPRAGDGMRLAH